VPRPAKCGAEHCLNNEIFVGFCTAWTSVKVHEGKSMLSVPPLAGIGISACCRISRPKSGKLPKRPIAVAASEISISRGQARRAICDSHKPGCHASRHALAAINPGRLGLCCFNLSPRISQNMLKNNWKFKDQILSPKYYSYVPHSCLRLAEGDNVEKMMKRSVHLTLTHCLPTGRSP
jgi:hypothetical protein